jgi:small-conductance mechanosensitive channel
MQLVWTGAPDTLESITAVRHVNGVLLIVAMTAFVMALIGGLADGLIARNPSNVEDNLHARRVETQTRVLSRSAQTLVLIGGAAMVLMTFPGMRQLGASLLASAGVLGIIGGLAARPVFSNLISGLQIALSQPIRIDDVLIVKGEWGRVEEITGTYVVLKIWDERRLIIPLQWFIENPFENWTRTGANILGTVFLYLDYTAPMEAIRAEAKRIVEAAPEWDQRVFVVQVTDATDRAMQVRILVSAANSGKAFDLRCKVREGMLAFLAREYPECLPLVRSPAPAHAEEVTS